MASGNVMAPVYIFRNRRGEAQTGHERLPGALSNTLAVPVFRIGRRGVLTAKLGISPHFAF